jgi:hypothetical protein
MSDTPSTKMIPGWKRVDCPTCGQNSGLPCIPILFLPGKTVPPHAARKAKALKERKADLDPRDLE